MIENGKNGRERKHFPYCEISHEILFRRFMIQIDSFFFVQARSLAPALKQYSISFDYYCRWYSEKA